MTQAGTSERSISVCNLTSRRIAIANRLEPGAPLLLPPFGERVVTLEQASVYDHGSWEAQQLVRIDNPSASADKAGRLRTSILCFISGYTFLITLLLGLFWIVTRSPTLGLLAGGGALGTLAIAAFAGWNADAWANMAKSLNVFFGLVVCFGFPAAAILFMEANVKLGLDGAPELPLALVILWLFLGMASVLPAALFLFFHRQKIPTLRENFLRDVVRLDPNVQTVIDAETTYDGLLQDVFGAGKTRAPSGGRLPILAASGVISGLWIWTLVPGLQDADSMREVLLPDPDIVSFAFLGAYVFAINMLFRRYTRADLGPKAYTHVMIRIFAAVAATWVLSFAPFARADGRPVAMMLVLAFFIGIVPETGTAIVQDLLQQWKPIGRVVPSLGEEHPLGRLDGMSLYDRSHLLEAGIENVESLAHHPIIDLMLWTRIPTARLVDFVDQAILYLHVRGPADATQAEGDQDQARQLLTRHGVRTATDLERAYALAAGRSDREGERFLALLDSPGLAVHRLRVVLDAMADDEWMVYVRNWRDQSSLGAPVASVEEFMRISSVGADRAAASPPEPPGDADVDVVGPAQAPPGSPIAPVSLAAG